MITHYMKYFTTIYLRTPCRNLWYFKQLSVCTVSINCRRQIFINEYVVPIK